MPALSAHLRDPDTHARLAFHPGCPICQTERLSGTLTSAPLVSQRARAALATGVLAISAVGPHAAFAGEPDTTHDGTADATQPAAPDLAQRPGFAPDGRATGPQDVADSAPVGEPASEPDNPDDDAVVDPDGGLVVPNPRAQPAPPPGQSPPSTAAPTAGNASPAPPTAPPAAPPEPEPEPELAPALASAPTNTVASAAATARPVLTMRARAPKPTAKAQAHAIATSRPAAVAEAPAPAPTLPTPSADAAEPGDRAHTVHAGESLWSIASDHLGPGAKPVQIAREVHRLWQLNADRIGTGDPDLLMAGTRLRLR